MSEESTTEDSLDKKYDAEEKRRSDEFIQKQLAVINAKVDQALSSRSTPRDSRSLAEIPRYSSEAERDIIESQEVQLESAQYGQTNAIRKVHSLRANTEGVIGEQIDNEDMLTRRLMHWAALEDRFDHLIRERRKREGRLQSNILRATIVVGIFAVVITLIVELTQPAVMTSAYETLNSFTDNWERAAWLLGIVITLSTVLIVFMIRGRLRGNQS